MSKDTCSNGFLALFDRTPATEGARFELREFYVHALSFTYWIIAILKAATVRTEETTLCLSLVDKVKKTQLCQILLSIALFQF